MPATPCHLRGFIVLLPPAPSSPLTCPRASLLDLCSRSGMICPAMYGAMAANLSLPYWVVTGHGGYGTPMVADLAQLRSVFDEALQTVVAMRLLNHRHGSGVGAGTGGTGGGRDVDNIERLSGPAGFAIATALRGLRRRCGTASRKGERVHSTTQRAAAAQRATAGHAAGAVKRPQRANDFVAGERDKSLDALTYLRQKLGDALDELARWRSGELRLP